MWLITDPISGETNCGSVWNIAAEVRCRIFITVREISYLLVMFKMDGRNFSILVLIVHAGNNEVFSGYIYIYITKTIEFTLTLLYVNQS